MSVNEGRRIKWLHESLSVCRGRVRAWGRKEGVGMRSKEKVFFLKAQYSRPTAVLARMVWTNRGITRTRNVKFKGNQGVFLFNFP